MEQFDAIVVGGGFYGARLALALRSRGQSVLLLEREPELMSRASSLNQARVHGGYHYPRSILTSLRSRQNYARFRAEYPDCVVDQFPHYYAIARAVSKITSGQFVEFCRRIGAPVSPAPHGIARLFDLSRIEAVFAVEECTFNAVSIRERLLHDLTAAGIDLRTGAEVTTVSQQGADAHVGWATTGGLAAEAAAPVVLNCTYSGLNAVLASAGAAPIAMTRELTELALVKAPAELAGAAVTVMDGPFFSLMPYPPRFPLYTLSHVRYTPHVTVHDDADGPRVADRDLLSLSHPRSSRFPHMVRDAARYLAVMAGARHVGSLWEVKAVMPRSEQDDSRPILLRQSVEVPALHSVLGAKIDSVYDVEDKLTRHLAGR